jgi:acyl-CoA reductase-like NAD-dependent aldehyde dehydrogenase/nicotinamidase-related amidase
MTRALVLVDLQRDFLDASPTLEPSAGVIVAGAARALADFRARGDLVVHIRMTLSRDDDRRMPHWRERGLWRCEAGTLGHAFAPDLSPRAGEPVLDKQGFSAFIGTNLDALLAAHGVDAIAIAGVHLHACVRQTALDAYQRGLTTTILEDAVGSDDPLHAAITRRYLEARAIRFVPASAHAHAQGMTSTPSTLESTLVTPSPSLDAALTGLVAHRAAWADLSPEARAAALDRFADGLAALEPVLVEALVDTIAKPAPMASGEVRRAVALARAAAAQVRQAATTHAVRAAGPTSQVRWRPQGVVLAITPYNNPVAIPIGKLAPALGFGNVVLWKPAPLASSVAQVLAPLLTACFGPALALVHGDAELARAAMADPRVDAVTLSGSSLAGHAAAEICARRRIPLQAELGGNNAALVWHDTDLARAAALVADGAFAFAGQRCTANRRAIVDASIHDAFVAHLRTATRSLTIGPARDPSTRVPPMVSPLHAERVREVLARAEAAGCTLVVPHAEPLDPSLALGEAFCAPTLVLVPPHLAASEIALEETFGPVLAVQAAATWDDALRLEAQTRHGLVAALFSASPERRRAFLEATRAGLLKLDQATADADAEAPFGGWKASGIGPPEHGPGNAAFYLRPQAVYGDLP